MTQIEDVVSSEAAQCPIAHHQDEAAGGATRSSADNLVRKALRVSEPDEGAETKATRAFSRSMAISTVRCSLTYLVFPFLLPALGLVTNAGIMIGIVIGLLAIVADVFAIRRVFAADHKWRWQFATADLVVITLLLVLLVEDIVQLST